MLNAIFNEALSAATIQRLYLGKTLQDPKPERQPGNIGHSVQPR